MKGNDAAGAPANPTKEAYVFVKGVSGWSCSPVRNCAENSKVPVLEKMSARELDAFESGRRMDSRRWTSKSAAPLKEPLCDEAAVEP